MPWAADGKMMGLKTTGLGELSKVVSQYCRSVRSRMLIWRLLDGALPTLHIGSDCRFLQVQRSWMA